MVRVALVGCGVISENHVRGYAAHGDRARITVCCDLDLTKATARADQAAGIWGVRPEVTDDYLGLLARPDVDSIELCTPSHLHADAAIAAARAGKPVACQKPLATTLADCDRMIAAATEAGTLLFYGEVFRMWEPVVRAGRMISEGSIGKVVSLQSTYAHWQGGEYATTAWRYDPKIAGGGQLIDGGIHYLDLLRTLGGPIESVAGFSNRIRPELGGEDTAAVIFHYAEGHVGTLMSTHASAFGFPGPAITVFGTGGMLAIRGPHGMLVRYGPEGRELLIESGEDVFVSLAGHYLDVLEGKPNRCPSESGREMLEIVLAAYRSVETGESVAILG